MTQNKEEIKNKIIYRSSYRGTKEMDLLMSNFIKSIVNDLNYDQLINLNEFVNLDDELIKSIKNDNSKVSIDSKLNFILEKFQNFK